MRWVEPKFSKKQVKRAGEALINSEVARDEWTNAMDVLSNWRAVHVYPMHAILIFLRRKASKIDKNAIVVQRLKRTPSIVRKLHIYNKMKLHRMQDIGGCRAVVKTVRQAERLSEQVTNSRTRNKLHKVNNYIKNPKNSGYRGIHLVYKYNGQKGQYKDLFVEIQLRSKIQHAWATAVEIIDTFTRQALKASQGSDDWLKFFRYVGAEFARLENRPVGDDVLSINTLKESLRLAEKLSVIQQLNAFTVTAQHIGTIRKVRAEYYLLELEENAQKISITGYSKDQLEEATAEYIKLEKRAVEERIYDVVLVSASSIHNLKSAYPNYFADSNEFIKYFNKTTAANNANSADAKKRHG